MVSVRVNSDINSVSQAVVGADMGRSHHLALIAASTSFLPGSAHQQSSVPFGGDNNLELAPCILSCQTQASPWGGCRPRGTRFRIPAPQGGLQARGLDTGSGLFDLGKPINAAA